MDANLTTISEKEFFPTDTDLTLALDDNLNGSRGTNRNLTAVKQIQGDTDLEAIESWLTAKKRKSPNTLRSYRREAYRLLAWSVSFLRKPLSSLNVDDVGQYHSWLQKPKTHPEWSRRGWEIIRPKKVLDKNGLPVLDDEGKPRTEYKFEDSSIRLTIVILSGMFSWLVEAGYLSGNPFKLFDGGQASREVKEQAATVIEHTLDRDLWEWAVQQMDVYIDGESDEKTRTELERTRFMMLFLYYTGLRRHELSRATMDKLRFKDGGWELRVLGKGRTTEESVVLLEPAVEALARYREVRGLPPLPGPGEEDEPLVASNRGSKSITDNYMNTLLKRTFDRLALDAVLIDHTWPEKLKNATAHWLRHTIATHNAEAGVPIQDTADQLRHRSIDTTRKIYIHAGKTGVRREGLSKVLRSPKSGNEDA